MDSTALAAILQEAAPGAAIEPAPTSDLHTTIYVSPDDLPAVAQALRDRPELAFDFLAEITAADYWPKDPRFEVVYHLANIGVKDFPRPGTAGTGQRLRSRSASRGPSPSCRPSAGSGRTPTGTSARSSTSFTSGEVASPARSVGSWVLARKPVMIVHAAR